MRNPYMNLNRPRNLKVALLFTLYLTVYVIIDRKILTCINLKSYPTVGRTGPIYRKSLQL